MLRARGGEELVTNGQDQDLGQVAAALHLHRDAQVTVPLSKLIVPCNKKFISLCVIFFYLKREEHTATSDPQAGGYCKKEKLQPRPLQRRPDAPGLWVPSWAL